MDNYNIDQIMNLCEKIESTIEKLEVKNMELKTKFQLLSKHDITPLFVYSLDSVFFQFYVCNIQMENFKKIYDLIQNHIYCDLFKLHRMLCDYVEKHINEKKINALLNEGKYPTYKDLEKYKVYEKEVVKSLYDNIILIIDEINKYCKSGTKEFKKHEDSINNGFHYGKILQTFHFNTNVVQEQISLFQHFLNYSCNYHYEYLDKICNKINNLHSEIPPLFAMGVSNGKNLEQNKKQKKEVKIKKTPNLKKIYKRLKKDDNQNEKQNENQNEITIDSSNLLSKNIIEAEKYQGEKQEEQQEEKNEIIDQEDNGIIDEFNDEENDEVNDEFKSQVNNTVEELILTIGEGENNLQETIPLEDNISELSVTPKKKRGRPKKNI